MKRPNILFIMGDQHRYDCVGAHGHPLLQTPHLDRLAREGADFQHAFTSSPICVPARCSLLTGCWPTQHGVINNFDSESFRPLPERFRTANCQRIVRDANYHTVYIGHWHVDPQLVPTDLGCHDYVPGWRYLKWCQAHNIKPAPPNGGIFGCANPHITPEQSSLAWGADQVIEWMERMQSYPDPFFLQWQFFEPHPISRPPEPYASMYRPEDIQPWPGYADTLDGKPHMQRKIRQIRRTDKYTWNDWAPAVGRYLGEISLIDAQIGRVLASLDRLGLAENTLVIYTADHGDMCGSRNMFDKHCIMYDDVVRVPLLMRWPAAIPAGSRPDAFVCNTVDLASTFVAAAGAEPPAAFSGRSILPLACGKEERPREDIFSSFHGNQFGGYPQRMVRDARWKYVFNPTDKDELYDLQSDPAELRNRILDTDPEAQTALRRLEKRMSEWMRELKDPLAGLANRPVHI